MKMKKIISYALSAALMLGMCSVPAFAAEPTQDATGCYAITEETPTEILEYAKGEFPEFLGEHLVNNGIDASGRQYSLGYPINLQESGGVNRIYDFPVMQDGKIFAILTIYDDGGEYYTQFEENLMAEKLNTLQNETSKTAPITFVSNDTGFFAVVNDCVEPLTPDSEIENANAVSLMKGNTVGNVVNITDTLSVADGNGIDLMEASNPSPLGVVCVPQTDDGTFDGKQMEWCGAAVSAAIINYKKGTSLTAKDVTIEALGSAKDEGLTNAEVISIGKNHGLSPKSGNPLSYSSVKTEINGYRPVYMQMQRKSDEGKKYHALTLIGYSSSKYTVLNPWQSSSITLTKKDNGSDVTYVTGTRTYKWYTSVYNWK
ncbi:MAG: Papain-like cysteine protease AvrRpt2 [Xylanivirga thermophila]|jgi:hypothetical protein|uniref:papain-like cysteine protease family protein n=1 Tax=Xylanivirga thermophila TaxID=2496273 RepID=UPI00101B71DF|nr:papain-like cysteine protease family protein [Xylanivirga thermophila]